MFNIRDISEGINTAIRRDYVFRSGSLEKITDKGKAGLRDLGIKTIFDLRSAREIAAFPDPEIEGVEVIAAQTDTDPMQVSHFANVRCGSMYFPRDFHASCVIRRVLFADPEVGIGSRDVHEPPHHAQGYLA